VVVGHLKCLHVDAVEQVGIEVVEQRRNNQFNYILDESLTDADTLPSEEWLETVRVSSFSTRCQELGALRIKPLWLDPLPGVVRKTVYMDKNESGGQEIDVATRDLLCQFNWRCHVNWRLHSHRLLKAV
jgi:hypothetical protein